MTNYDNLITKSIDELAVWLNENYGYDSTPWGKWFNDNYCSKCKPIICKLEEFDREIECAPCELKDLETNEYMNPCGFAHCEISKIIKAWLVQEVEDDKRTEEE